MQNNSARRIILRGIGTRNMTAIYIDDTPTQNNSFRIIIQRRIILRRIILRRIILRRIILRKELFCVGVSSIYIAVMFWVPIPCRINLRIFILLRIVLPRIILHRFILRRIRLRALLY